MGNEKRHHPRYPIRGKVRGQVFSPLEAPGARTDAIRGRIQNMSAGGLCLLTDRLIEVSDPVRSELLFPQIQVPVPTLLQVRWTHKTPHGQNYLAGLQFLI